MLRTFLFAAVLAFTAKVSRGDSELVVAIRYLQPKGTSHSHLYLYREDGKLLRQLTNDNSGQDSDPIFAPNGETIVFTRQKPNSTREFWSIDPLGKRLKKVEAAPDWYSATKKSSDSGDSKEEESPSTSPMPTVQDQASRAVTDGSLEQGQHRSVTALDVVADAEDHPPQTIKAPDGSGEIFWRKEEDNPYPDDPPRAMWFRDSKSRQETEVARLPGFPSFEPLRILFEGPLRLMFFSTHINSQDGDTVFAFNFNKRKLIQLSPNWAMPIALPGEAAFLTLTENRYVQIPGSTKTANCSYVERWGAELKESCDNYQAYSRFPGVSSDQVVERVTREQYEEDSGENKGKGHECYGEPEVRYARKNSAAICYGASMYRPGKDPAVVTIGSGD